MKDNFDIFFRRKPALMLVALSKVSKVRYGSVLAKEVDCTYSHAVKILQSLSETIVSSQKKYQPMATFYSDSSTRFVTLVIYPQTHQINPLLLSYNKKIYHSQF